MNTETEKKPASAQSDLTDVLADPFQAVLDTIDDMKSGPWESSLTPIGFVDINGDKAQVQIRVTKDPYDWVEAANANITGG